MAFLVHIADKLDFLKTQEEQVKGVATISEGGGKVLQCTVLYVFEGSGVPTQAAAVPAEDKKTGVLFVCLGNICRSPAAEAVFQSLVTKANLGGEFRIDSCGTGGGIRNWYKGAPSYHEGGPADERMMATAVKRGIDITSRSRPLKPQDLQNFDYILAMDFENKAAIQVAADYWASDGHPIPANYRDKLLMMCSFLRDKRFKNIMEVPDPYWSDDERGFNQVLDMLEDSCQGLLDHILSSKSTPVSAEVEYQ